MSTTQTQFATRPLADRYLRGNGIAAETARLAAANLLMVLCAWIALPLPGTPVPVTGQTFGVLLVAALFGARRGSLALGLYLLEGACGLLVFQPFGAPGVLRFFGPTAGFLLMFPLAAYVTGWLVEHSASRTPQLIAAMLSGEAVIFTGGCVWLAYAFHLGFHGALLAGLIPFIPGELVKMVLVLAAVRGLELGKLARA
jgi:biotin transport system substrate-specific component